MDTKALAKSKRAHSQHHSKKHHPNQKAKAPVDGGKSNDSGTATKPLGKQVKEKNHPTQGTSALPSNWDRYAEEFDLDPKALDGPNEALDVVLPKSKGADYGHLIAEAQSQSQLNVYSNTFLSLDDVLSGDWDKGLGSMLSVRGETILSRVGDDNFVVEDKTASHHEVSFLSFNLHALAEQLEKIDLSQRLFIEADLLPPELMCDINLLMQQHAKGLDATCSQSSDQMQATFHEEATEGVSDESTLSDVSEKVRVADHDIEISISGSPESGHLDPTFPNLGSASVIQGSLNPNELGKSDPESKLPESKTQMSVKSFEAGNAEAELDMLLDSFGETKINESSGFMSGKSVQEEASRAPLQLPRIMTGNLDDALDDLINETSLTITQSGPSQAQAGRAAHNFQSSSHSASKSKELDDFDSWLDTI